MSAPSTLKLVLCVSVLSVFACQQGSSLLPKTSKEDFSDYWHQGKTELSGYRLDFARYDTTYSGEALLIFTTEDFSKSKTVKPDHPEKSRSDVISVLKLNTLQDIWTGAYPYHLMSSVYTPVDMDRNPHSLKFVCSTQDGLGQTYMQGSWKGHRYEVKRFSYFETERDTTYSLVNLKLEDEIWTMIRITPATLPLGKMQMMPSATYLRLYHKQGKAYEAQGVLTSGARETTYTLVYPDLGRQLNITFETPFPHRILSWSEHLNQRQVTRGYLINSIMSGDDNQHIPGDSIRHLLFTAPENRPD